MNEYEQMGKDWLDGKLIIKEFNGLKLNDKQVEFVNNKSRSLLISGGMSSGKTLAFIVKCILLSQFFPNSHFLIGRKTQGNAEDTFMKDFMEVCPAGMYTHQKGNHKIVFSNGSEAEFWGLDALQSGASTDIKKAEQKLKSHNFTFIFTDQLEEIELKVFDALQTRMRRRMCKHSETDMTIKRDKNGNAVYEVCSQCGKYTFNQYCATTNPANFWGYDYFKVNPRPNTHLIETSTLDNKSHLTEQFIQNELQKPEAYKAKFFYGQWDDKSMVEGGVFYEEWILNQRAIIKPPIRVFGGVRVFEEPQKEEYQIGIDPSIGASDPCNITCISKKTGRVVATYSAYVPTNVIVEKAVQIALMYSLLSKPLIVPEATGIGQALVEGLKPVYDNIYIREIYADQIDKKTTKLGFYTTHSTKTQLIENMKELFQKGFPKVYDEDTVNEINKFIYTDSAEEKGAGAQKGYHDDRCFVAGIKILTDKGNIDIENIKVGDLVMTRKGYRNVIAIGNHQDKVINNLNLIGTPNHPVITKRGLVRLDSILPSDILYIWNEKLSLMEEKTITDILNQNADHIGFIFGDTINGNLHRLLSIGKSGLIILEKYLKGCLSIIKMVIHSIISHKIFPVLQVQTTLDYTSHQKDKNNWLKLVINKQKDWSNNLENGGLIIPKNSKNIKLRLAEKVQLLGGEKRTVYNIEVEDCHEYFANGILVHNCMGMMLAYWNVPFVYSEEFPQERIEQIEDVHRERYDLRSDVGLY